MPDEGTLNDGFRWFMDDDAETYSGSNKGSGPAKPYTVYYKGPGTKTATYIKIGSVDLTSCAVTVLLTVKNEYYENYSSSSSSEEDNPGVDTSSSYSSSSSSSNGDKPPITY